MDSTPMQSFYAMVFRQKYIRRWGLMHSLCPESLSEHAMEVAALTHALALIGNRIFGKKYDAGRAVTLALFHDLPEVYTGDLPTPVKYYSPEVREGYRRIESHAVAQLLSRLPAELRGDYEALLTPDAELPEEKLVKIADKLCAYIKCMDEEKAGNSDFSGAKASLAAALEQLDCPELSYFRSELLPAFSQPLDRL